MKKIARELLKIAKDIINAKRPNTYIEGLFYDIKEQGKKYVDEQSKKALGQIATALKKFIESKGIQVISVEPKTGSFRGHVYVSSCPIVVKTDIEKAKLLLPELINKFSPKFKFKGQDGDTFKYNMR